MNNKKRVISATYMNNIVSSMGEKNNNYVFVKHYGSYSIDAEDAKNAMTLYENLEVNYVHLANNDMAESYAPFLSIIRSCYEKHYISRSLSHISIAENVSDMRHLFLMR